MKKQFIKKLSLFLIGMLLINSLVSGMSSMVSASSENLLQYGDFEQWDGNLPTGWNGNTSNLNTNDISKVEGNAQSGNASVRLTNSLTTAKRFSSQPITLVGGAKYTLTYWVKGSGEIRNGYYADDYSVYSSYTTVNSGDWKKIVYTFTLGLDKEAVELIFGLRNTMGTHIQIDNVVLEQEEYVANIGSQGYYTLQDAFNAVADNDTIELLNDITLTNPVTISSMNSKSFTLELNGKTLNSNNTAIRHNGSGTLMITDNSSGLGKVTSATTDSTSGTIYLGGIDANTVLEIQGGTMENTAGGNAIYNGASGKIVISSGSPIIKGGNMAMNAVPDLTEYDHVKIMGSKTSEDGTGANEITSDDIETGIKIQAYKYLEFSPATAPDAPTDITAAPGDGQLTVTWTAPTGTGGSPITTYEISIDGGGNWESTDSTNTNYIYTGLTNGTSYTVKVRAVNAIGKGAASTGVTAIPVIYMLRTSPATDTPTVGEDNEITLAVVDGVGNVITNFDGIRTVRITGVEAAPNGSYGSFAGTTITSPSQEISVSFIAGLAEPILVLNKADEQEINFKIAGIADTSTNTITITPSAGALSAMELTQDITAPTVNGGMFAQQPKVILLDVYGNQRIGDNSTEITVSKKDTGAWTLTGTTTVTASAGVATFSNLGATNVAQVTGAQLAFQANTLTEITSSAVTLPWSSLAAPSITSVVAGDGHVAIGWNGVYGTVTYAVYQREAHGSYGAAIATVDASVLEYDALGLTNGTTYYFMVKAINPSGVSDPSNEVNATPQVPAPGVPNLLTAVAGNSNVTLTWTPVNGSTGYNIYQRLSSDSYKTEVATVTGSVYSYQVTGLTNGTMYYFAVQSVNPGGESDLSNEVSTTPMTVPSAPTQVRAVGGDGLATITFNAPDDQGGSTIMGYEVTVLPDHRTVTGGSSPITITGLTNGRTYTFVVRAINSVGSGSDSVESNEVRPQSPPSDDHDVAPQVPSIPARSTPEVDVLINGRPENAGIATTSVENGRTIMTVTLDPKKLGARLQAEGSHSFITIPIHAPSNVKIVLNGQMVKDMEAKQDTIEIRTDKATYTLPALQVHIDTISEQIGRDVELEQIEIEIEISDPTEEQWKVVENAVNEGEYTLVVPPLNFSVRGSYGDVTVDVSKFNAYVKRTIAIPDGVDPNKITTGVVIDPDGTVRHVPTAIELIDGKYYATINSLTNSTYAVISNPVAFKDVAGHWAEKAVNDMGSRLVISGIGDGLYNPDHAITRAEFAAIMVRALGFHANRGATPFSDVRSSDWYSGAVVTAFDYKLISGYEDDSFRPQQQITREQAMVMIASAMEVTGLKAPLPAQESYKILQAYDDADQVSEWARNSVAAVLQAGILTGRGNSQLAPQAFITRAEVAVIIQRLLQRSELI
ncbi:MAG: S-layer homology domain-containing protein [Paenibacillus sp.]|uniref:fibronectin type III domain-containing protein n=1 Tax=Paenibacillus sp. TaxID=58172 RepID=UPI00291053CE|nr:S-layer homology domain-containing protein [Paenibacillus sp.]MDU4696584.1 S-layer homology domain-containing protein [Paenibacillus sp.]